MADPPDIPYPPNPDPDDIPDGLTDYPPSYLKQQKLLLYGLFVFLLFYLGLVLLTGLTVAWCAVTLAHLFPLKLLGIVVAGLSFLYLVKGFFKRRPEDKTLYVEVTADDQPVLFGFIDRLCDDLDAPRPDRVFVSPDVNAAVMPRTSLANLFVEPKKDLLIGLGLVEACNLSEFKSVMAHEFGHFGQSAAAARYSYVAYRIIIDLIEGEDWFDRGVNGLKRSGELGAAIGGAIGGCLWVARKGLDALFGAITRPRRVVSREQEFHADLTAVKTAGSEAVALSLMRLRFGHLCLTQALDELAVAADHKLYTRDLFYHQGRAEGVVRQKKKAPGLGVRPPDHGPTVRVFDPEREELEHDEIPEMRRTYPPADELERNAKAHYVPAAVDDRSPWCLFTDADDLKERISYRFYRQVFQVKRDVELADPAEVQRYIDGERADTTYDPKYQGVYDDRVLEPGDLAELDTLIVASAWDADRLDKVLAGLMDGAAGKAEEYADLGEELAAIENTPGTASRRLKQKAKKLEAELERARDWFRALDRRSYLLYVQLAARVDPALETELVERYRFQMEVQRMFQAARHHQGRASAFFAFITRAAEDTRQHLLGEFMSVLREARRALKTILRDAREVNLPAMRNFEEGERLADFILPDRLLAELPETYVKGKWVYKLLTQLNTVRARCTRLHFKSVGGILALQERVADRWREQRQAVVAEVVDEPFGDGSQESGDGSQESGDRSQESGVRSQADETTPPAAAVVGPPPPPVEAESVEAEVIEAEVVEAEVLASGGLIPPDPGGESNGSRPPLAGTVAPPPPVEAEVVAAEVVVEVVALPDPPAAGAEAEVVEAEVVEPEPDPVFVLPSLDEPPAPAVTADAPAPAEPVFDLLTAGDGLPPLDLLAFDAPPPPVADPAEPVAFEDAVTVTREVPLELDADPPPATATRPADGGRPAVRITFRPKGG